MNSEDRILEMIEQIYIGQQEAGKRLDSIAHDIDRLNQNVTKIEMEQGQKLDALFDGYSEISNQIKKLSVIDALQDDVATLKTAVRYLSAELEKLKLA